MPESLTVSQLLEAKALTDEQVDVVVEAYLANPAISEHTIAPGLRIDFGAEMQARVPLLLIFHDVHARIDDKRMAIRTAILLARVERA